MGAYFPPEIHKTVMCERPTCESELDVTVPIDPHELQLCIHCRTLFGTTDDLRQAMATTPAYDLPELEQEEESDDAGRAVA